MVLFHSRRAFSNIGYLDEARLATVLWPVESMTSLNYNKIFAGAFKELFLAVQKPHQWPALGYQAGELKRKLALMEEFQLLRVTREENIGAAFIAQSVTRQRRLK